MRKNNSSFIIRIVSAFLLLVMFVPINANASSRMVLQPKASEYLSTYGAYIYPAGNGKVQVWFDVEGTDYMDEIGCLSIQIYECSNNSNDINDWTWKDTFKHNTTSGMLSYNDDFHNGYVQYNGTVGKWYKAYVCVWAGKDGGGDTRYFWTYGRQATAQSA